MAQERNNNDGTGRETLSFAEFLAKENHRPTVDRAVLLVAEPGGDQQVFPLARNPTVIGRSNNADLVLSDPGISDFHARIIKHSFGYTVEDMGSAEGTYLGDRRVNHARLVNGDSMRLGATTLTFLNEQAPAPAEQRKTIPLALVPVTTRSMGVAPSGAILRDAHSRQGQVRPSVLPFGSPQRRGQADAGEEHEATLEDVLLKLIHAYRFLRSNAWLILGCALAGLCLGAASFKFVPPVRAAFCMITLQTAPKTNPIEPESHQAQTDSMQFFSGVMRAFVSPESILSTLRRIGVSNPSESQAEAIAKRIRFEDLGNNTYTATMTPSLFGGNNDSHVHFLDAHVRNYVESEIEKKLKTFVAEVEFLRVQTDAAEKSLQAISKETVQFREANSDQILAQTTLTAGSPATLETRKIELTGLIHRLTGEIEGIRSQQKRASPLGQARLLSGQADRDALAAVGRKLTELRAQGFADGHPEVARLLTEQAQLKRSLDEHLMAEATPFEKKSNVAYDALQSQVDQLGSQLRAAVAERSFIEENLRSVRQVSNQSPKVNARIAELLRMNDEAVRQHGLLFDRLKKAEVQLQLERVSATSRYEIATPARLETPPGKKAFLLRLGLGLVFGLFVAAGALLLRTLRELLTRVAEASANASVLLVLFVLLPLGCAHDERFTWIGDTPLRESGSEAVVHARDTILVEVDRQPTLSGEFVVRDDGHYSEPMVGSIAVADQTPRQVAATIATALKDVIVTPVVSVWITKVSPIRVSVVGEVKTPGTFELQRDRSLLAVLAASGWLTDFAHADRIFVVRSSTAARFRFRLSDITTAEPHAAQFQLADADIVVVE